jgi:3-isopropylmalate dehydrogenase
MSQVKRIAVIPGDGIGPEVIAVAVEVLSLLRARAALPLEFEHLPYGSQHYLDTGVGLPRAERLRIGRDYHGILLGAVGDPRVPDNLPAREIVLGLRTDLDLYVNLRPIRLISERVTPLKGKGISDIHYTILRENTEGIYGGLGGSQHPFGPNEIATAISVSTHRGVDRMLRAAFEHARLRGHDRVCFVHKANAIPQIFALWLRLYREIAREYPDIAAEEMLVDRAAMEMIRAPEQFRTVVTTNLLGDILSDLAAQTAGGLGLAASANIHPGRMVLCEPVHGSAPDITGKGIANPMAACLSASLLLEVLGFDEPARAIEAAVVWAVREGITTPDLGGTLSTQAVGEAILGRVGAEYDALAT